MLEIANWKTDVYPAFDPEGTQAWIDSILKPEEADILVGVFWKRFGTAGTSGKSGTEHEIQLAKGARMTSGKPWIMLYFKQEPYSPQSSDEAHQWGKVLAFKEQIAPHVLYRDYASSSEFRYEALKDLFASVMNANPAPRLPQISVTAVPAIVRATSVNDSVGEIQLAIVGYPSGTYDIRLFLAVRVTNQQVNGGLTDAHLSIDGSPIRLPGELIEPNGLVFRRVTLDSSELNLRIKNVRAMVSMVALYVNQTTPIWAWLSIQQSATEESTNVDPIGPAVVVADVRFDASFQAWGSHCSPLPVTVSRSVALNAKLLTNGGVEGASMTMYLVFNELTQYFFKTEVEEGNGANCGTRLRATFRLPNNGGTQMFVTTANISAPTSPPKAVLVRPLSSPADKGRLSIPAIGTVEGFPIARLDNSTGENDRVVAEWEWVGGTPAISRSVEDVMFGVVVATPEHCGLEAIRVTGSLGPVNPHFNGVFADTIPQFVSLQNPIQAIRFVD